MLASCRQLTEALRQTWQDRMDLSQQLAQAQANAQSLQAKINQAGGRTALDTEQALAANRQVEELRASIEVKDKKPASLDAGADDFIPKQIPISDFFSRLGGHTVRREE